VKDVLQPHIPSLLTYIIGIELKKSSFLNVQSIFSHLHQ
jgi:hypothetical protein